ncbi:unnamed protein product [Pseudo-nitzschia multistriata]|uniref:Selenoprotein O n=1 Tax=Pseudo-nitzschia multistriata TaxID=183589 RepID=A0A448Z838_9STRA|nr:unnamed protein product [Pseudo-nitzschia multistriata]
MTTSLVASVTAVGILSCLSPLCQCFTNDMPLRASVGSVIERDRRHGMREHFLLALSAHDEAFQDWSSDSRIDVRNLLTQRAIQSFMFLCEECRDPHSGKWIEDFLKTQNLLNYHGTGASFMADVPWDGPLLELMDQPEDVMIVSAKRRGRGHGGWSKNNPYLQDRYVEFKITIDPASLTDRILAVREQLAAEWVNDLEILGRANQQILDSYFQLAKDERNQDPAMSPAVAFERTAVDALNSHTSFGASGSPFRMGSFDLLYNLCTQASIHRLLRSLGDKGDDANLELLRDFYVDRLEDFFDGDLPFGKADDFIEELLLLSPSIIHRDNGNVALTDPFGISEQIIEFRNDIFSEWIEAMKLVPTAHQDGVRKRLLNKRMEAWNEYTRKSKGSGNTGAGFQ